MAVAKLNYLPINPPPSSVTLELTIDEAMTLRRLCDRIAGDPMSSRRVHTNSIAKALDQINIMPVPGGLTGEIRFNF